MNFMIEDVKRVAKEIGTIPQPYLLKAKHMTVVNKQTCTYCQLKTLCDNNKIQEVKLKEIEVILEE